jgi:hypothetical protein
VRRRGERGRGRGWGVCCGCRGGVGGRLLWRVIGGSCVHVGDGCGGRRCAGCGSADDVRARIRVFSSSSSRIHAVYTGCSGLISWANFWNLEKRSLLSIALHARTNMCNHHHQHQHHHHHHHHHHHQHHHREQRRTMLSLASSSMAMISVGCAHMSARGIPLDLSPPRHTSSLDLSSQRRRCMRGEGAHRSCCSHSRGRPSKPLALRAGHVTDACVRSLLQLQLQRCSMPQQPRFQKTKQKRNNRENMRL